jgi:hypothetical protein
MEAMAAPTGDAVEGSAAPVGCAPMASIVPVPVCVCEWLWVTVTVPVPAPLFCVDAGSAVLLGGTAPPVPVAENEVLVCAVEEEVDVEDEVCVVVVDELGVGGTTCTTVTVGTGVPIVFTWMIVVPPGGMTGVAVGPSAIVKSLAASRGATWAWAWDRARAARTAGL